MAKTHSTAAVIVPPHDVWRPIQLLRARYDRKIARWMPHITMAYPFRPREEFPALAEQLRPLLATVTPFTLELARFFFFEHGNERYTLWLSPEPRQPLFAIEAALGKVAPECDEQSSYQFGFTPHLSIGQVQGTDKMEKLRDALQEQWEPMTFPVTELSLLWRNDEPDDVYRVGLTVPLGA